MGQVNSSVILKGLLEVVIAAKTPEELFEIARKNKAELTTFKYEIEKQANVIDHLVRLYAADIVSAKGWRNGLM